MANDHTVRPLGNLCYGYWWFTVIKSSFSQTHKVLHLESVVPGSILIGDNICHESLLFSSRNASDANFGIIANVSCL